MNRISKKWLTILIAAVVLVLLFVAFVLLSLPLGDNGSVLPPLVMYVAGGVISCAFLASAAVFFIRSGKGS